MIKLGKMTVTNFLSVGPMVEIDFSTHSGVNYVFGTNKDIDGTRNGVGKTGTLVDPLLFALFGETSRKVGNKYIGHRQAPDKETLVSLAFETDKGKFYIEAGLKRGSGFLRLHENDREGKLLNKGSIKETRRFLEREILGMDYLIAKSSFFLTSSDSSNFLTMKKDDKRKYIESIFKLAVFGDMLKRARADINTLDKEIDSAQNTVRSLVVDLQNFEAKDEGFKQERQLKLSDHDDKINRLLAAKPEMVKRIEEARATIEAVVPVPLEDALVDRLESPVREFEGRRIALDASLAKARSDLAALPNPIPPTEAERVEVADVSEMISTINAAKASLAAAKAQADAEIANHERNLKKCENVLKAVCEKCKPVISTMYSVGDDSFVEEKKAASAKFEANSRELDVKLAELEAERRRGEAAARMARDAEAAARRAFNAAEDAIRSKKAEIEGIQTSMANFEVDKRKLESVRDEAIAKERRRREVVAEDEARRIKANIERMESDAAGIDAMVATMRDEMEMLRTAESPFRTTIDDYSRRVDKQKDQLSANLRQKKILDFVTTVVGEDGVKRQILKDIVEIVNNRVQKYLGEVGAEFTCVFDGSFDCEFVTKTGLASYENFSSGEKMRINLAVLFTFRDILLTLGFPRMNVLMVDELIDSGLDSYAVNAVAGVLRRMATTEKLAAFLISHRECYDDGIFNKIVEVVKEGGFSSLIEDSRRDK